MIYLAYVKPYILLIDNRVELFNTWANGNVLLMVISIGGITPNLKIEN